MRLVPTCSFYGPLHWGLPLGPQDGGMQRTPRTPHAGVLKWRHTVNDHPGRVSREGSRRNTMSIIDRKEFYRRLLVFVVVFVVVGVVLVWLRSS